MLVGVHHHPSFFPHTYFDYETFNSVRCFLTVFGIRPIFEMHRGMWPGYTFFSFSRAFLVFCPFSKYTEAFCPVIFFLVFMSVFLHLLVSNRFWHFAHFRNAQKHAIRLYIFLVFMSVFGILSIFEIYRGMWSGHIFSRFHAQPQKSNQTTFQKC